MKFQNVDVFDINQLISTYWSFLSCSVPPDVEGKTKDQLVVDVVKMIEATSSLLSFLQILL